MLPCFTYRYWAPRSTKTEHVDEQENHGHSSLVLESSPVAEVKTDEDSDDNMA